MTKVCILKFPYASQYGGGERHTMQLVDGGLERGVTFSLCSSDTLLQEAFAERSLPVRSLSVGLEPVSPKGLVAFTLRLPYTLWQLRRVLRAEKPDVVYCLSLTEKLVLTRFAAKRGVRVVWVEHLRIERWLLKNPYKWWYRWASRWATVVGVSKAVSVQLRDEVGVPEACVKTIYNGVDTARTDAVVQQAPKQRVVVGSVGRLVTEKGYDVLLRAFAKARALAGPKGFELVFEHIGTGVEQEALEALASELGVSDAVTFHGFSEDPEGFLSTLDVFALTPVRRESFGMAAAEASWQGLPVVATALSGLAEVVAHQETGLVCPVGDVDAIAKAFVRLATDDSLRAQYGLAGRERVRAQFSLDRMVDAFTELFSRVGARVIGLDVRDALNERPAGKAHYAKQLLTRTIPLLVQQGCSVVLYSDVPIGKHLGDLPEGVILRELPQRGLRWHFSVARRVRRRCDGVERYASLTSFLVPALVQNPLVVVHDLIAFRNDAGRKKRASLIERLTLPRVLRRVSSLLTVSQSTASDVVKRFPRAKALPVQIVSPGPSVVSRGSVLDAPEVPYFLCVGTLEPRKNQVRVIEAFAALRKRRSDLKMHLVLAGSPGWDGGAAKEAIARHGLEESVQLLGFVKTERLAVLYQGASALVFPSLYEGFGMPILEAFSFKVPVITSSVSSLPEVAGEAAVFVPPQDVEAISWAMERVLTDAALRAQLIRAGTERLNAFSWDDSAQRLADVLASG